MFFYNLQKFNSSAWSTPLGNTYWSRQANYSESPSCYACAPGFYTNDYVKSGWSGFSPYFTASTSNYYPYVCYYLQSSKRNAPQALTYCTALC